MYYLYYRKSFQLISYLMHLCNTICSILQMDEDLIFNYEESICLGISYNTKDNDSVSSTFYFSGTAEEINRKFDTLKLKICGTCCDIYQNPRIYNKCFGSEICAVCNKTERVCLKTLQNSYSSDYKMQLKSDAENLSEDKLKDGNSYDFKGENKTPEADSEKFLLILCFLNKSQEIKKLLNENQNMPICFEELQNLNPFLINSLVEIIRNLQIKNCDFLYYREKMTYTHLELNKLLNSNVPMKLLSEQIIFYIENYDLSKFKELLNEISYFFYTNRPYIEDWSENESEIHKKFEDFFNSYEFKYTDREHFRIGTLIHLLQSKKLFLYVKQQRNIELYILLNSLKFCEVSFERLLCHYTSFNDQNNIISIQNKKLDLVKKINEIMLRIISCVKENTNYYISFDLLVFVFYDITDFINLEKSQELKYAFEIIQGFHLILFILPNTLISKLVHLIEIIIYMIIISHRTDRNNIDILNSFNSLFYNTSLEKCWDGFIIEYIFFLKRLNLLICKKFDDSYSNKFRYQICLKLLNSPKTTETIIKIDNVEYIMVLKNTSLELFLKMTGYINSNISSIGFKNSLV